MRISKNIYEAIRVLRKGGIIVYPTDTAYGLGANPFSKKAIKLIYQIKGRSFKKPLPLIAGTLNQVERLVYISQGEERLIKKCWPGSLTILFKLKDKNLKTICEDNRIGIRIPKNRIALRLVQKLGHPITATSANKSGGRNCYSTACVLKQFKRSKIKPDFILEGGRLREVKPSTIVVFQKNHLKILRQGSIRIKPSV